MPKVRCSPFAGWLTLVLSLVLLPLVAVNVRAEDAVPLIPNGNFETAGPSGKEASGWPHLKLGEGWQEENGNHFLRLTQKSRGETISLSRECPIPAGTKALELTWRQRTSNLKVGTSPWFDARIVMEFQDAAGNKLPDKPGTPATNKNSSEWIQRSVQFLVPEGAVSLTFKPTLFRVQSGTFDLDDVVLKGVDPAPLIAKKAEEKAAQVPPEAPNPAKWPKELHVDGNHLADPAGKPVWLQGVNAGGLESAAVEVHVQKSAVVATDGWKANIIRLPVSEAFWFGHSEHQQDGGESYRKYVDGVITLVANRGAYVLLDLHRFRAPKAEHVEFWKDAAARYKNHPAVLFDLFNEPHGISWEVWKNGGFVEEKGKDTPDESAFLSDADKAKTHAGFESVGMQALINAVRGTGARNIVVAGGLTWANDLTGVVNGFALEDKTGNGVMYSWHVYNWHKGWEKHVLGAAAKYPILVGEVGCDPHKMNFIPEKDQEDSFTWFPDMIGFIQKYKLNWTAWCLHPRWTPVLILDWNYTPTPYWGVPVKEALAGKQFELKRTR